MAVGCACGLCMTDDQIRVLEASTPDQRVILKSLEKKEEKKPQGKKA